MKIALFLLNVWRFVWVLFFDFLFWALFLYGTPYSTGSWMTMFMGPVPGLVRPITRTIIGILFQECVWAIDIFARQVLLWLQRCVGHLGHVQKNEHNFVVSKARTLKFAVQTMNWLLMCVPKFQEDCCIFVQFMTFYLGTLFLGHPVQHRRLIGIVHSVSSWS